MKVDMRNRDRTLLMLSLAAVGACALHEAPPQEATTESFIGCPVVFGCGANASSMSFELDMSPPYEPNYAGLKIIEIDAPPEYGEVPMTLEVEPSDPDALIGKIGKQRLSGGQLIWTSLKLLGVNGIHYLLIAGVSRFEFMVGPRPPDVPAPPTVTSYKFLIKSPGETRYTELCPEEQEIVPIDGEQHHALVFRGDRYRPGTKEVFEDVNPWVNIACAGTAVAKLHLLRHTKAGRIGSAGIPGSYTTTVLERQAMLQMLRADYCGDGTSYTVDGTPIRYSDHKGWYTPDLDITQPWQRQRVEALWNGNGAVCLDLPRRSTPLPIQCSPERQPPTIGPCSPDLTGWQDEGPNHGHVVSAKPGYFLDPPLDLPPPEQLPAPPSPPAAP